LTRPAYLYDVTWRHEQARLQALEDLFDPASRYFIERLGIAQGWQCLEVGFGAGSMAVWFSDRVGPSGRVLATDLDPRLLPSTGRPNLRIVQHDLMSDALAPEDTAAFDLVHTRAVLAHIPDHAAALRRLLQAVRPGGWLVVEDMDATGPVMAAAAERYTSPLAAQGVYRACMRALHEVLTQGGRDPGCGAALPTAMRELGLQNVGAELHAPIVAGGAERDCMRLTIEYLHDRLLATGLIDRRELEQFLQLTRESTFSYVPLFMVTAWGRTSD
jgi:ubiquinone/menaquinone biosynthesis C-methylase UbiE